MYGYTIEHLGAGDIRVYQHDGLYKFTSDAVLLAKFARPKKNEAVADFCAGSGVVGLYFYGLHKKLIKSLTFFEIQKELSDLCQKSVRLNNLDGVETINCRVQDIDTKYNGAFSLILCNPPYERKNSGFEKSDRKIALCTSEIELTLEELVDSAAKRLKFGGRLCLVHRANRLAEVIYQMKCRNIEPKRLQFVENRTGGKPYLFLIEGVLGAKCAVEVLPNAVNSNFGS